MIKGRRVPCVFMQGGCMEGFEKLTKMPYVLVLTPIRLKNRVFGKY